MTPKYTMTREQNIFLAKRNIVEYIYNSACVEGCKVTYSETQTILDGVTVGSVTLDDVQTVLNLRDAWRFVLSSLDAPLYPAYLCKVNEVVSRYESMPWGVLRTGTVDISGTNYRPPIPKEADINKSLEQLAKLETATEVAILFFLYGCRAQLFWNGTIRTSTLCANRILIGAGEGILTIRDSDVLEFNERLLDWYNTGEPQSLAAWLYDHCIDGIAF